MIHLTATFIAKPEKEQQLHALLQGMLAPTRAESGNLRYQLFQAKDNACKFVFQEHFANQAAFDAHCQESHFSELLANLEGLLTQDPDIVFYNEVTA